jgi:two-component system LytT family sensor kinase
MSIIVVAGKVNLKPGFMNFYNLAFSEQRSARLRRHLLFWAVWSFYWLTTYLIPTQWIPAWNIHGPMPQIEKYGFAISTFRVLMNTTLITIIYMGLIYGILYFFLPRYVSKSKNWITTSLLLLLFVSFIAIVNYFFFILVFSISTRLGYFSQMPGMSFIVPVWARQLLFNYPTVVGFALAIKVLKNWYLKQKETAQVGREIIIGELQLLKAQVHPHFLFNTLNNIYSFIINDSNDATEALKKLSTLLRYIIYECDQPLVQLEKELKMIKDYVDLEKIRYGKNFNMSLQVQGNPSNKVISPLLLIPFLENSFKHGASQMLTHPWINLDIAIQHDELEFTLSNSKPAIAGEKTISNGLGLRNVKKRLSMLYPATHSLNITDDVMSFSVSLKVPVFQSNEDVHEFGQEVKAYELV